MRDDEFNSKRPSNLSRKRSPEYGKTQKDEYSFSLDHLKPNKPEVNNPHTKNDSVKENTGLKDKPKVINTKTTEAIKTSSVVHSVTAAATVIAVSTVSVVAGIGIVKSNQSSANFLSFDVGMHEFFYVLRINSEDEEALFYIDVSNRDYENRQELHVGENEGMFEGLTPGDAYTVTIKEAAFPGTTLYNEVFYAKASWDESFPEESSPEESSSEESSSAPQPAWNGLLFDKTASYKERSFEITLDFEDEENFYTDFVFTLQEPENDNVSYDFPLEKTTDAQTILLDDADCYFDVIHGTFNYELRCNAGGEPIVLEQEEGFSFEDNSGAISEIRSITFSEEADYLEGTFDVTLDFVDELDEFYSFFLRLSDPTGNTAEFYLIHQTETQTIHMSDSTSSIFALAEVEYDYELVVYRSETSEVAKSGKVTFSDSARGYISSFVFPKTANFDDCTFDLSFEFVDPKNRISNIVFTLKELESDGRSMAFDVEKKDGTQTFYVPPEPVEEALDLIQGNFEYTLAYDYDGITTTYETGEVSFENSLESHFNEFRCDFALSENDNFIPIYMDFVNDAHYMEMVEMHLTDNSSAAGETVYVFYFELVQGIQMFNFSYDSSASEVPVDALIGKTLHASATVSYYDPKLDDAYEKTIFDEDVSFTRQQISEVYGMWLVSTETNSSSPSIAVQPYFVDDFGHFEDIQLGVKTEKGTTHYYNFDTGVNFRTDYESIDLLSPFQESVTLETILEEIASPIDLSIRYKDEGQTKELVCLTGVQLEVL